MTYQTPTASQLKRIGRYMQQADPEHTAELRAEFSLTSQEKLGRYYFECDPAGFWESLQHAA